MDVLLDKDRDSGPLPGMAAQGEAGTSTGLNIEPGSDDDGWVVPEPVGLGDGSLVQLYKDGEALHAAYEAIKLARRRICLEIYIFASDETGRAFADLLCDKAKAGVKVYLIYDSFGSIASDPRMFERMRHAGVRVNEFHPFWPWEGKFSWRPLNRDHRKLLVIDEDVAWLGGMNLGGEYGGSWVVPSAGKFGDFWRDNAIGIRGAAALKFFESFRHTWRYTKRRGRIRTAEYVYNLDGVCGACEWPMVRRKMKRWRDGVVGGWGVKELAPHLPSSPPPHLLEQPGQLGILASAPTVHSPLKPFLNKLFREARRDLWMTMAYFAPHDDLIDELCAAARRGVRVRLMLPGRGDVAALIVAARSFYETLLAAGVEIYERQGVVLHAKTMVIDGTIGMVGSTNLDYRSIEYNLELSALVRSTTFGRQMEELFENDVRYAKRMTLGGWRRRPVWDRVVQWVVSRTRYLL
ncbi:MAG: Bac cardiolipin: cardiolipin [Phycisphaerales bacterium]|nr:Bac cardiolipin: cardiolipin [Phycisphaerales bacterium]